MLNVIGISFDTFLGMKIIYVHLHPCNKFKVLVDITTQSKTKDKIENKFISLFISLV